MVDPDELKRNGLVFGTALLNLANTGPEQANMLMNHVYTQSIKRIADNGGRARDEAIEACESCKLEGVGDDELAGKMSDLVKLESKRLDFLADRDRKGLRSALRLIQDEDEEVQDKSRELAESLCGAIDEALRSEKEALVNFTSSLQGETGHGAEGTPSRAEEGTYEATVPKRNFVGSLSGGDFMRRLTPERRKQYMEWVTSGRELVFGNLNAKIVEMWSFADGERNISQIAEAVTFEYGPTDPNLVMEIFSDLEKIGYVELA
jgi:hypothetical protein